MFQSVSVPVRRHVSTSLRECFQCMFCVANASTQDQRFEKTSAQVFEDPLKGYNAPLLPTVRLAQ